MNHMIISVDKKFDKIQYALMIFLKMQQTKNRRELSQPNKKHQQKTHTL